MRCACSRMPVMRFRSIPASSTREDSRLADNRLRVLSRDPYEEAHGERERRIFASILLPPGGNLRCIPTASERHCGGARTHALVESEVAGRPV